MIDLNEACRVTGVPKPLIRRAMAEHHYADPMFAAAYAEAAGLAVNIRGDRHAWNERRARQTLERLGLSAGEGTL